MSRTPWITLRAETPVLVEKKDAAKPITAKQLRELVKSFPWDEWNKKLAPDLEQVYRDLVVSQGSAAAGAHDVSFDQDDPFLQKHMTEYIGERITQLSRTSQKDVTRALRNALAGAEDLTPAKLQEKVLGAVRQTFENYEAYRALRVARTESAIAYNHGGVLGGLQAGFKKFEVIDGTDDEECAKANGQVWSATKCLNNPIAHPNCVRSFFAVDDAEVEE